MTKEEQRPDNEVIGQRLYLIGDGETRDWFHRQWKAWPTRVDERLTTNGSLHYGGVLAYRIEHDGKQPSMSSAFAAHVEIMDRMTGEHRQ